MRTDVRRDRLLNLLYRGATTVPEVARQLGVSERTVYRDIALLRDRGYSIRATPGPGGGVRIDPEGRPHAVHFEVTEIVGLALSVAILRATPHLPFATSAGAALDRARRALAPERRRAIRKLEQRIWVGSPAGKRTVESLGPVDSGLLSVFEQCFTSSRTMAFDYVDGQGAASTRRVECVGLILHSPCWYVMAWDLNKDAFRLFRMDRIRLATVGQVLSVLHTLDEVMGDAHAVGSSESWGRRPLA